MNESKQKKLRDWMKMKGMFSTSDVIRWGLDNYYVRADRTKKQMAHDGIIRRLSQAEAAKRGLPKTNQSYFEWVGEESAVVQTAPKEDLFA